MKTETNYIETQNTPALHSKQHLESEMPMLFSAPVLDAVINPIAQTMLPILSDTISAESENFIFHNRKESIDPNRPIATLDTATIMAQRAIEAKAAQLGWVGKSISEMDQVGQGYVMRYEAADIYYAAETGAHEVHGDIRAKYNAFGAANGILGLPTTDESGTPDSIGRFNHFQGGSIYWTINTGPMVVRGSIRDMWAAQGWETNERFAYPIADHFTKTGNPAEFWGGFQNGAMYSKNAIAAEALVAEIAPQELTKLVRKTFDQALKAADSDLGIEGGVNVLNISNWGFGFWESKKRMVTYEIHGFYSLPAVPDPTFRLELQFQFGLIWRKDNFTEPRATNCDPFRSNLHNLELQLQKTEKFIAEPIPGEKNPPKNKINPAWTQLEKRIQVARQSLRECNTSNTSGSLTLSRTDKTLVIYLRNWRISSSGVGHGELHSRLVKEIPQKFPFAVQTIPASALLIDLLVTPQGGLKFLLQPNVDFPLEGKIRRDLFQTALNNFIES